MALNGAASAAATDYDYYCGTTAAVTFGSYTVVYTDTVESKPILHCSALLCSSTVTPRL